MPNDYYNGDLAFSDYANALTNNANTLIRDILEANLWFQKFYALTYGLTVPQIQALPGFTTATAAGIEAMQAAYTTLNDFYNLMNNVSAPAQANRVAVLAPFTN